MFESDLPDLSDLSRPKCWPCKGRLTGIMAASATLASNTAGQGTNRRYHVSVDTETLTIYMYSDYTRLYLARLT